MRSVRLLLPLCLVAALGCGGAPMGPQYAATKSASTAPMARTFREAQDVEPPPLIALNQQAKEAGRAEPAGGGDPKPEAPQPAALPRKIIYTADVRLVVNDLSDAEDRLRKLIKDHGGFVARSDVSGRTGSRREGNWTIRVPVARFDEFLAELTKLGVPETTRSDSRDVSEEFYDLQSRIKNKKVQEERLLKHLEKSTGKLDEILTVEKEISRVRGEIEQMEGKMKVLADLTELTTVTVHCQEIKDYVPPQAPTFGQTVANTFGSSTDALVNLGKGLVLVVAALLPWIPLIALVALPTWLVVRRMNRPRAAAG